MSSKKIELEIFTKTYDFMLWMFNHTNKFPKSSRFSVAVRIENMLLDFLETIMNANRLRNKIDKLKEADKILEFTRILIRISKDMKFLGLSSYEFASRSLNEIGRLLGGWLRQQKSVTDG
ncbi:MAG: diversity-generating retroelement protein Avd [Elusimicrobia bacterium]|nr:diversity-generating retroelement protein Avd [Elusimicrobiota bacterium]